MQIQKTLKIVLSILLINAWVLESKADVRRGKDAIAALTEDNGQTPAGASSSGGSDLFSAGTSYASEGLNKRHSLGVGVGETFLSGGFSNQGQDSITTEFFYGYRASYSFEMILNAHHYRHKSENSSVRTQGLAVGIKSDLFHFDSFAPFILGGVGFYRPQVINRTATGVEESEEKTVFGLHFGAGGDLQLNNQIAVGLLGHYHNPFDLRQKNGQIVDGSYFKLLLTLRFFI